MKLIDKSALVAELERRKFELQSRIAELGSFESNTLGLFQEVDLYDDILSFLNTLEVKGVDLDEETLHSELRKIYASLYDTKDIKSAKRFYELGMRVNNPITAADRGMAEEIIINLKRVEQDYRIDLTKEIEWVRNQVKRRIV